VEKKSSSTSLVRTPPKHLTYAPPNLQPPSHSNSQQDVGHSDEAREILAGLLKGTLKGSPLAPKPIGKLSTASTTSSSDSSASLYIALVAGVALAIGAWKYLQIMGASTA